MWIGSNWRLPGRGNGTVRLDLSLAGRGWKLVSRDVVSVKNPKTRGGGCANCRYRRVCLIARKFEYWNNLDSGESASVNSPSWETSSFASVTDDDVQR